MITDTVSVYRLEKTGSKEAYGEEPILTGLDCQILPASNEIVALYGGNPAVQLFEIHFSEHAELHNGDKLVSGATSYVVRGMPTAFNNRYLSYTRVIGEVAI